MKIIRITSIILCVWIVSSLCSKAEAADVIVPPSVVQYASELSQYTDLRYYKNDNTQRYMDYKLNYPDYTWNNVISYVNIGLDRYFYSNVILISNPGNANVLVNKYRQLPSDFIPSKLENISRSYCTGTQKLIHSARIAFEKMCADAKKRGYSICAVSAYRSYDKQAQVYASYHSTEDQAAKDLLAARPGFSEHQTGLAVDISRSSTAHSVADVDKWYAKNAYRYGFIIRYPCDKQQITGYASEPWHLRYLGAKLATAVYKSGLTYDEYFAREIDVPVKSIDITAVGITTASVVIVDGTPHPLSTYNILGETYFKLRDIAFILNGTAAQIDIAYDGATGRINIIKGTPYTSDLPPEIFKTGCAVLVTAAKPVLISEEAAYDLSAYRADGSNYFKLADILNILGITATDNGIGSLFIDTGGRTSKAGSPAA